MEKAINMFQGEGIKVYWALGGRPLPQFSSFAARHRTAPQRDMSCSKEPEDLQDSSRGLRGILLAIPLAYRVVYRRSDSWFCPWQS